MRRLLPLLMSKSPRVLKHTRGENANKIESANRRRHPNAGAFGPQVPTFSPDYVHGYLDQQLCPWCGRGPFKVVALHVAQVHGIGRKELRDLAGLKSNDSICSKEFSDGARSRAVERNAITAVHDAISSGRATTNPPTKFYTRAGLEASREGSRRQIARVNAMSENPGPKRGGAARGKQMMKERLPCVICGSSVPRKYAHRTKTCSPECRSELKSRNLRELRAQKYWASTGPNARKKTP